MTAFSLLLVLFLAFLLTGIYSRATARLTEPGRTILDAVIAFILALILFWGVPHVVVQRTTEVGTLGYLAMAGLAVVGFVMNRKL